MRPAVSICIPTYEQNGVGAKHLRQLLYSIPTGYPLEIIVSDNSDSDVIQNMVKDLNENEESFRNWIYYERNPVKGAVPNTNHAINRATGDIIKLMYQDDFFTEENSLEEFVHALETSDKHWCISDSWWVGEEGNKLREFRARCDRQINPNRNSIGMPSVIAFKKTDIRFDPQFQRSFDIEFYFSLFKKYGKPAHIKKPLIAQRIHKNSLSATLNIKPGQEARKIFQKHVPPGTNFFHRSHILNGHSGTFGPKSYKTLCETPSDINVHLPLLKEVAMQCEHVTEFGVRNVVSTYAFLEGTPKDLVCYDIKSSPQITAAKKLAVEMGVKLHYKVIDVLKAEIAETDFLFIDTLHNYQQLRSELERHSKKVRKFIGFHDVTIFGLKDETRSDELKQGLLPAILEFMQENPSWCVYRYIPGGSIHNNGCLILKKNEAQA